jgi:peptide/nickel transport system substrate-binding protein
MVSTVQPRVFLAGRVAIETDGRVIDEGRLAGRQGRLVFAYLVSEQGRPVPRDQLAEVLWGQTPPATWEKALTVIASKLRGALTDAGVDGGRALTSAFGCYRLELPEGSWVDLNAAAAAVEAAEQALAAGDPEAARADASLAASLVRQPFLPGDDGVWVEQKRRETGDLHFRAQTVLSDACLRLGDAVEAAKWAEQAIALEPFRESGYRRLMEANAAAGNRAEALRVYERCRRLLAEELGAYPSPETESIYRELLAAPAAGSETATAVAETEGGPPLRDTTRERAPAVRRRTLLVAALAGVIAAAVAVPLFAFSSGGSRATQFHGMLAGDTLGAVSSSSGHIFASIPLSASPDAVATGAGSVWTAMSDQGSVLRINPATKTVQQTIVTGGGPSALTVGGGFVWVADSIANTVTQIDPRADGGQPVKVFHVGNGPSGIAYGLGAVWVADSIDRTVVRIDPRTETAGAPIPVGAGADAVAAGDDAVWVLGQSSSVLSRVDPSARAVVGTTSVGNEPDAVAVGPNAVWVANGEDDTISRIDPSTGHLQGLITVGKQPSGLAVGTDGRVWVANALSATISVIDPAAGRVVEKITTGALPEGVALLGDTVYVATQVPPSAHRGGTLRVAIANSPGLYAEPIPRELDPASGYSAWEVLTLTNDGLLGYSKAGGGASYKVVPDLATAPPIVGDGGLTYTFQLRRGIRYSTGALVRPADVRRGIERALLESDGQTPGAYLSVIAGAGGCLTRETQLSTSEPTPERLDVAEAVLATCLQRDLPRGIATSPGSETITFHLSRPDPDFPYQLALPDFDAVPALAPLDAHLPLPATGPYEISGYRVKGTVDLVRNPSFRVWSPEAQPDGYPNRIVEQYRFTGRQALHAVMKGAADVTAEGPDQTWPPALAASLETRESSQLHPVPMPGVLALWLNTRLPPFNDIRVRRALNYAVDRNRLAQINGGSVDAELTCQILAPGLNGYSAYCPYDARPDAAGTYTGPDLAKARRLVAASGTKGQSVTIWFPKIPIGRHNGRYLVSVLRRLGYRARLSLVPHKWGFNWRPGRQAGVGGYVLDYPSTNDVFLNFLCASYTTDPATNSNAAALCNRRLDAQIARARLLETTNPAAAATLWSKLDRELMDLAPWVPMKVTLSTDFVSRRVGNYKYCWVSAFSGLTGACLDQLWVR